MEKLRYFFESKAGRVLRTLFALIPAAAALAIAIYYIVGPGVGYLHSDCTDSMYWANASYESGKVFDDTYRYAALLPFSAGLWMTPLIALFGFGMTAHNIGMILFAVLFAGAIFFCCRSAKMSVGWSSATVFAVFLILSSSDKLREILWGHVIYYSLSLLILFFGLGLVIRWLDDERKHTVGIFAVIALFTALLCCGTATDGFQVIAISTFPLGAAVVAERLFAGKDEFRSPRTLSAIGILAIIAASTLLGMILLSGFRGKIEYEYEYDAETGALLTAGVDGVTPGGEPGEIHATSFKTDAPARISKEDVITRALSQAGKAKGAVRHLRAELAYDMDYDRVVYIVRFSVPRIASDYANAYSGWSDTSKWVENAEKFLASYLTLIGIPAAMGGEMFSTESILSLVRIFAGGLILIVPLAMLLLYPKIRSKGVKLILWSYWCVFAVIMLGFVCGKLSTANWRLTPIVGAAVMCTMAGFHEAFAVCAELKEYGSGTPEREEKLPGARVAVRASAILLAVLLLSSFLSFNEVRKMPFDTKRDNVYHKCAAFLEEHGLEYGYATFWYSQVTTMLSDSRVKTSEIMVNNTRGVYTDYYQSSRRWYEDDTHENYFVMLTQNEYDTVKNTASWIMWIDNYLVESYDRVDNYLIYTFVFSENVLNSAHQSR